MTNRHISGETGKNDQVIVFTERGISEANALDISLLAIFSCLLGILGIMAWIVPFGHITMEFLLNIVIVTYFRLKRLKGSLLLAGCIAGLIDAFTGLGGAGFFLAPIVYGFRYGFIELVSYGFGGKNASNRFLVLVNAIGYMLTSTLIFLMYAGLSIPLGDAFVQRMWFVFAATGAFLSIPATIIGLKVFDKWLLPHLAPFLSEN